LSELRMSREVYDAMREHGEETYPDECCGALLGRVMPNGWWIEASIRAGNSRTDSAHNRYQIAPGELVKIERESRLRGLSIAGFYHSHPDHPAEWQSSGDQLVPAGRRHGREQAIRGRAHQSEGFGELARRRWKLEIS